MRIQMIVHTKGINGDPFHQKYPEAHVYIYVEGNCKSLYCVVHFDTTSSGVKEEPKVTIPAFGAVRVSDLEPYVDALRKAVEIANRGWLWVMSLPQGETWVEER